eukprot:8897478-Pyramimonas_sp.AAC.2
MVLRVAAMVVVGSSGSLGEGRGSRGGASAGVDVLLGLAGLRLVIHRKRRIEPEDEREELSAVGSDPRTGTRCGAGVV